MTYPPKSVEDILGLLLQRDGLVYIYENIRNYVCNQQYYYECLQELYKGKLTLNYGILKIFNKAVNYKTVWDRVGKAMILYDLPSGDQLEQQMYPSHHHIERIMIKNTNHITRVHSYVKNNEWANTKYYYLAKILINTPFYIGNATFQVISVEWPRILSKRTYTTYDKLVTINNPTLYKLFTLINTYSKCGEFCRCQRIQNSKRPVGVKSFWKLTFDLKSKNFWC